MPISQIQGGSSIASAFTGRDGVPCYPTLREPFGTYYWAALTMREQEKELARGPKSNDVMQGTSSSADHSRIRQLAIEAATAPKTLTYCHFFHTAGSGWYQNMSGDAMTQIASRHDEQLGRPLARDDGSGNSRNRIVLPIDFPRLPNPIPISPGSQIPDSPFISGRWPPSFSLAVCVFKTPPFRGQRHKTVRIRH